MAELGLARVRAATMAALPNNTLTGNVLTAAVSGALPSQDGVSLVAADSVLVRQEADARKNGRYVVTSLGSAGTPWVLTRHSEADTSGEARAGMSLVFVDQGSVPGRVFGLTTTGPITLNTTPLNFIEVTSFIKTQPLAALENGRAIDLRDAGARGDNVADDGAVLQAVLAAASCTKQRVVVPAGHYRCSSQIKVPDGCYVDLELQHGAHLDFSTATTIPAREACLTFGTHRTSNVGPDGLTPLPGLAAPALRGDLQVTFASAPALQAGDLFIVVDSASGSWNVGNPAMQSARPYYRAGDYCRARSAPAGNVVQVDRQLFDTYAGGGIQLYKVTTNRVHIHGSGKITAPGLGVFDSAIHVQNGYRCRIEGIEIVGARYAHIEFWRCYESDIVDVKTATWNPAFNEGAGVFMISCYDCWVRAGSLRNGKHAISLTGGDVFSSVPNRVCGAKGARLKADTDAADMHGHAEHCGFYDCIIEGGVSVGGNYSTLSGCTVFTNSDNYTPATNFEGLGIRLRELKGASHTIKNVELIVNQVASNGVCPVALDCYDNVLGGTVIVENLTIRSTVWNPTVMYLNNERAEMADLVDVVVDGLRYEGPEAPTGERAPTLAIRCGLAAGTGYRTVLIKDTQGVSPQCDNSHARLVEFRGVRCDDSPTVGALLAAAGPSYAHTQILKAVDCQFHDNKAAGLWVHGGAVGNDVYAIVENTTSLNNGQTGSGADSTSLKVTQLKQLLVKGNTWGDTQASPTQDGLVSFHTVTTVRGSGNQTIGTIHYGTSNARLLTSVTNDLELIELVGTGSPEGVQHAPLGTTYTRRDGLSGPVRYVKGPGTSNTGWLPE